MRRALWIVGQAGEVTLHERELEVISDSLSTLADAVYHRVRTLQGMLTVSLFTPSPRHAWVMLTSTFQQCINCRIRMKRIN